MLQWQGISIPYHVPPQEIRLWNFTKEDKCQFVLPDPLFVQQSGKSTTLGTQRIYLYGGEQLAYLTSISAYHHQGRAFFCLLTCSF